MKKRVLSMFMALALCLTLLPAPVWAEETENNIAAQANTANVAEVTINGKTTPYTDIDAAFAAAQQAGSATVKLLADVTISHDDYSGIALKKGNITLDLNGKTLSKSTRDDSGFFARNAVFWLSSPEVTTKDDFLAALKTPVRLTVQDNSTDGNGKIVQPNGGPAVIAPLNTILTVNGGTIENTSSVDLDNDSHMTPNCAVQLSGGGKAVINGGTLRGMRGVTVAGYITKEQEGLYKEYFGIEGYNNDTYGNELTVTDGNICATSGEALIVYKKAKKIELSGGIFTTQSNAYSIWVADTEAEGEPTIKGDASSLLASGYRYEYNGTECAYSEDGKGVAGNATVAPRPANEYAYIDKDGKLTTQANCTEITERTDDISTPGWYVLKEDITISLLNISGEVNLILCDGATLTVTNYMNVTAGSTLNLFWQSAGSGKLTAAAISVLGNVTAPAGEMKQTTGEGGTTFEKCFEHDWGYTNNGDTHTAMCKLCGKAEAAESHKYDSWAPTNANTHTGTCACGATKTEDHTLTCTPNADGLTHSTKCSVCGYTAAAESHDFNQTDNYGKKCACGAYLAAECNGQQYATLARAIEAANGADIKLLTIFSENVVVDGASIKAGIILGNGKTIDDIPYPSNWVADRNGIPLTMEAGEITLKDGALAQFGGDATANVAIALKGGTLTVADTVTKIIGSVSYMQNAAINATGGVLDLQGNTLLDGGLTMSGDARLKNKLTAGTFTNSGSESYSVSVEGSSQYGAVFDLLETGYAFAVYNEDALTGDVIAEDTTTRELAEDVAVIKCTHKDANNKSLFKDNTCTGCGFTCAHETVEKGVCTVCGAQMVAQDNIGKYYIDLAEAFEGVADGGTVTMLTTLKDDDTISFCCDAEGNPVEKTVTLMMNGHSLSYEGNPSLCIESGKLIIGDDAAISQTAQTVQPAVFVDNNEQSKDRGTLEFKGKANLTGGLLIQNWGKLVGGLKEGTIITSNGTYSVSVERSDTYGNVLGLLGDGLAFAKYDESAENKAGAIVDGSVKQLTEDVIVVAHTTHTVGKDNKCACGFSCTHGGTNGLDENATACPYCNAPAVAETDLNDGEGGCRRRRFADLQTAIDADRDGGTTLQLLADVTGDYTIDGTRDTRLDLNGHRIKGTVTVKAAVGNNTTTFSNTQNTTTASIDVVVAYKGAKLAGSDYPAVIGKLTLADTTKWKDILQQPDHIGFMVKNTDGTHTWYAPDDIEGSQLNNVIINYDKAAPDWSGNESGIRIKSTWWNKLLSSVTFGRYKGSSLDVYAKANDSQSGVAEYYYYIDNSGSTTTLTAEELGTKTFTKVDAGKNGTTKLTEITSDNSYVVYAYAVDAAGNRSTYISSDGVVVDNTAPKLTDVSVPAKSNETLSDTSATITFTGSEAGTYYYILKENGETAPTEMSDFAAKTAGDKVDTWTAKDGVSTGTLTADEANTIKLTGLKANTGYVLYLAATDTAGNASVAESAGEDADSGVVSVSFTTAKPTPYVKTAPVLSGTYGNTVSAMFEKADMTKAVVTAGRNSDTKVEGTWTLASEDADKLPTVGTSEKYTLVFTPTGSAADIYDPVTCEVTPEVSKKQITVVISDKEKFYGETNPALTWSLTTGDAYLDNVLVAGDTEEALGISLSTTAKDNSNVGIYAITGLSDSANYEVTFKGSGSDGKSGVLTVKQAANSFTTALSCLDHTYAKNETSKPNATAKFGTVTYKYAKADSDGNAPVADSAYTDAIPVNAGSYAVKAYVAETDNYAGLTSDPVVFTINKAASPNIGDEEKSYAYAFGSDGKAIGVDIAGKLPTDRGTTTYVVAMTDTEQLLSEVTVDTAGNLTYKVNQVDSSKVGKTAIITVTASMENYANAGYTLAISITDKKTVEIKRGNSVSVDGSNVLIYGEKISKLTLGDTVFVEAGTDDVIEGILSWSNPDEIPAAGTTQAGWVFRPADSTHYAELTGTAAITVAKATPLVATVPTVAEREYNPDAALTSPDMTGGSVTGADGNSLAGTWSFTGTNIVPTVNNKGYQAVFTPNDTNNYNTVTRTITVKVTKATPVIAENPTATALTYGQKLSDSTLTGGKVTYKTADGTEVAGTFAWKNSSIKPTVADSEVTQYEVVFTPTDADNYNVVESKITLVVNKADVASNKPESTMNTVYTNDTIGKVTLPEGWTWKEEDKTKALEVGKAVTATAIYNGADKDNYETHSVEVSVTRQACTHIWDEGVVTKEPTATEKGEKTHTCTVCKATKTEEVAALGAPEADTKTTSDDGKATYKVTTSDLTNGTVAYVAPTNKKATKVTIPDTVVIDGVTYKVTAIEKNAFKNNKKLKTLKLGKNIISIGDKAFYKCTALTKVTIPDKVKTIGKQAFYGCKNLKTVTIGKNVSKIGSKAFYGCKKLKTLIIKSKKLTTKKIGSKAFSKTPKSMTVKVPKKKYKSYKPMLIKRGVNKKAKFKKI